MNTRAFACPSIRGTPQFGLKETPDRVAAMRENVGVLSPNEKEGVMNRGLSLVRIIRSVRSWRAWSWPVAGICSLVALSLSCLQTAMADELLPSIAIERAGAETSDVSSPSIAETTGAWAVKRSEFCLNKWNNFSLFSI